MGAKETVQAAQKLGDGARRIVEARNEAVNAALLAINGWRWTRLRHLLADVSVDQLQAVSGGGIRVATLKSQGFHSVSQVLGLSAQQLMLYPGIGQVNAFQIAAAAQSLAAEMERALPARFDIERRTTQEGEVLASLRPLLRIDSAVGANWDLWQRAAEEIPKLVSSSRTATSRSRRLFSTPSRKRQADSSVASLARWSAWGDGIGAASVLARVKADLATPSPSPMALWGDFERNAASYYATLEALTGLAVASASGHGDLASDVAALVEEQPLDVSLLKVSLRGYQAFGARFALSQVRAVLGDEMGLGKTVQAIAALAHRCTEGGQRFLVVCPASVLVNWEKEVTRHSQLRPIRLHGALLPSAYSLWSADGGVGITTFDALKSLPACYTDMLVVDEAHYIKNPTAGRTKAARTWIEQAGYVLLMTGTPIENRVEEFVRLISYVQPELAADLGIATRSLPAEAFRAKVAPVYLRRNTAEVLHELPELIESDEWTDFSADDLAVYRRAVAEGNFMAMRRAAFSSADISHCAKLARLVELVNEAQGEGRKVVVFSYFRDVLATVAQALGGRHLGPLTGSASPSDRQLLIERFTDDPGATVLLSQIVAGGTGLNIQAASEVILCEPQVKPSLESQAIKRTHRMGQVRTVAVHRLLTEDSVDERMLEMLAPKVSEALMYAERSSVADGSPAAVDISEASLAVEIVRIERERLGLEEAEAFRR